METAGRDLFRNAKFLGGKKKSLLDKQLEREVAEILREPSNGPGQALSLNMFRAVVLAGEKIVNLNTRHSLDMAYHCHLEVLKAYDSGEMELRLGVEDIPAFNKETRMMAVKGLMGCAELMNDVSALDTYSDVLLHAPLSCPEVSVAMSNAEAISAKMGTGGDRLEKFKEELATMVGEYPDRSAAQVYDEEREIPEEPRLRGRQGAPNEKPNGPQ